VAGASLAAYLAAGAAAPPPPRSDISPASVLDGRPSASISNGILSAKVYLPVPFGFYHGTRFDHAGIVTHLTYKGQDYGRYWFSETSPDVHDFTYDGDQVVVGPASAVAGPVEEFDEIGFEDAPMGGSFLKIGVGILKRDTEKYDHVLLYPIVNAGKRTAKATGNGVRFTQEISGDPSGYGYSYVKTVRLVPGKPEMTIAHVLKNTGTKPIVTMVYCHNFLSLSPGDENIELTAPFALISARRPDPALATVDGKTFRYVRKMTGQDTVSTGFTGFGASASDYDFRTINTATGYGVRTRADQPLARINMWSIATTFSWEPYIAISLKPGETKRWTYTYDYFAKGEP
jgi:hypothetical protein